MGRYSWSRLNTHQVGRYAEYFVKMEFALYGFEIYTAEVDDRGIEFVARHGYSGFCEIQVKSVRKSNYIFMPKSKFPLRPDRLLALVLLKEEQPPDLSRHSRDCRESFPRSPSGELEMMRASRARPNGIFQVVGT